MGNKHAIGLIDSGVGGLTVLKEALKQLPNENLIYLGDTARCPYGPRPAEQVIEFTRQMTHFLIQKEIKLLVIACNTATAVALDVIRQEIDIPVVGVILPGTRAAVKATNNHKVGVIGTQGTIKSASYQKALQEKTPNMQVFSLACPKFVPLVESNQFLSPVAKKTVAETLVPLQYSGMDTLILGCTHYPLLRPIIQNVVGSQVQLIDSGAETVGEVSVLLDYFEIANSSENKKPRYEFYTTGSTKMFNEIANEWLNNISVWSKHVNLEGN
ncbi:MULTISPECIES: glutamate racemase [Enterococcus]|jgi:glutamate racemase|uniref:Glutamate racemase n=1 Tax=Enterococcus dispar ATCC 51266 TaxID=1139219 RepID=S1NWD5_9ENTE|nr:glutamate racemase [Enterococcus dispar]EOT43338.1 glutamate racemase [Enterococcus dispar ATCC 51266]EOW85214.1 glutamate racemase [Enterococcus dispar ATCC 51266]MCU7358424.1 glutamate racemase [Enterococcus dispar]MDT2706584.1 glutamate racemase [Enterococcus dispar]WCG33219.1 glutamate racemase [Enterococcus dispar]